MKKKIWIIPLSIVGLLLITFVAGVGTMLAKGYGASTGVYLESKDGAGILIKDRSPILMSSNHNGDIFDGINIGDKIFVIHDGIAESYPARTSVYAVFKINDGTTGAIPPSVIDELTELGWLENEEVESENPSGTAYSVSLSYANWTDDGKIYTNALNLSEMQSNSIQHLPIYKFDALEELNQFKKDFCEILEMDGSWDEVPSFNETTIKYDETFFKDNALLLVYIGANNCTHRFGLSTIAWDERSLCVQVEETTGAEFVDEAMAGWFLTIAVPKESVAGCTEFDAVLIDAAKPHASTPDLSYPTFSVETKQSI